MNTSNVFDIAMVTGLSVLVLGGLVAAGMSTAIVAGAVIGGTYMLSNS